MPTVARCMTEMSMQHGTFSRQDIAVSLEESPGFSRGEDVNELSDKEILGMGLVSVGK